MKKIMILAIFTVAAVSGVFAAGWGSGSSVSIESVLAETGSSSLSQGEEEGLILMREEEKLARDVYLTLYDMWGLRPFSNIARAESMHMDYVEILLERYNLEDPIHDDTIGLFTSPDLQNLYNELISIGSRSLEDALRVGATIEDLDIFDLERLLRETDNDDIKIVYQNLLKGSRNHMRSFEMQISRNGDRYEAQYISSADLSKILSTNMERGGVITNPDFQF